MNKLKEYAGLLNEEAPENHFLAYITPSERDMLVDAGGKKTSTPSGIFAYPPPGEKGGAGYVGGSSSKSSGSHSRSYNPGAGGVVQHSPTKSKTTSNTGGGRNPSAQYTSTTTVSPSAKQALQNQRSTLNANIAAQGGGSFVDKIKDFYKTGGVLGAVGKAISPISASMQAKAMTWGLNRKIKSRMGDLDLNNPNTMKDPKIVDLQKDLQGVKDGTFTQSDYTEKYGSGDVGADRPGPGEDFNQNPNQRDPGDPGDSTPRDSPAAKWFANQNYSNNTFNFSFQNEYNTAKARQASILGNPSPMKYLAVNQSPYYDFLKKNKLDRGIL